MAEESSNMTLGASTVQFAQADFGDNFGAQLLMLFFLTPIALSLILGILYGLYFLLTLPMRRRERARLFLDLLELGLAEGRAPEKAIVDAASSRDRAPGVRFHLLAAHLESGMKFTDALTKVPCLLPPQITAMLKSGERIGDIAKVLPACRKLLRDGVSQVRGALNYLLILAFVITPFTLTVPIMLAVFVLPKFKEVFAGIGMGRSLPFFTAFIFSNGATIIRIQIALIIFIWLLMIGYVGGPRLYAVMQRIFPGIADRILFQFPWRRRRLQRDFSAMLAVLLDAGVSEPDAVALAAESTANTIIRNRAKKVTSLLQTGVKLPDAIRTVDDTVEFQWRLSNALHRGSGFLRALTGWHEALDAKAFQCEQAAAQITTSALVIFNGLVVAGIVIAIFLALIDLVNQATLW
jgi:type II secretory pathway component PulF